MGTSNRVELLIQLMKENDSPSIEIFDQLVPHFHIELHCLYTILDKADVINHCKFLHPPLSEDDELTVKITTTDAMKEKCLEYISDNESSFTFLRTHPVNVIAQSDGDELIMTLVKEKKEEEAPTL